MKTTDMRFAELVELPSRGAIYEEGDVPSDIMMSSMRTKHEQLRLSALEGASKVMAEIIDDCSNLEKVSSYDLCLGDYQYLLYRLRMATYGDDYELYSRCPLCGLEHKTDINLNDMSVRLYDEDMNDLFMVELPECGKSVTLTLQTPRMIDQVNKRVKDYMRKHASSENPSLTYTLAACIVAVDEEPITIANKPKLEKWVEELAMKDTITLINRIDELNGYIGIDNSFKVVCPICGQEYEAPFRVDVQFWRPAKFK